MEYISNGNFIERYNGDSPTMRRKEWYFNGELHRDDGHAIEYFNGRKEWYVYGKLHRTNGPAAEYPNGSNFWWINDKRHRDDGPAIEYFDGTNYEMMDLPLNIPMVLKVGI